MNGFRRKRRRSSNKRKGLKGVDQLSPRLSGDNSVAGSGRTGRRGDYVTPVRLRKIRVVDGTRRRQGRELRR